MGYNGILLYPMYYKKLSFLLMFLAVFCKKLYNSISMEKENLIE